MTKIDSPAENLKVAVSCISEAARLHLMLKEHSTKEFVIAAMAWRFGITSWEAEESYEHALKLLDRMPKAR